MDSINIPVKALIGGPTNPGKTQYLVDQLQGRFRGKFDYTVLICPTFLHNKTNDGFVDNDSRIFCHLLGQEKVEICGQTRSLFWKIALP